MELDQVIKNRHSTRAFEQYTIERDKLDRILNAANMAPSAGNLQAYEIYVVSDLKRKKELVGVTGNQEFLAQASVCLVFCANPSRASSRYGKRGQSLYCIQDATIAATFAVLKAVDEGFSTAWVGAFDEKEVIPIIGCQGSIPVAIIPIGKPAETPAPRGRRALQDLVHILD